MTLNRRMGAFHQDYAIAFDDDGAYANQWEFWEFAFHVRVGSRGLTGDYSL